MENIVNWLQANWVQIMNIAIGSAIPIVVLIFTLKNDRKLQIESSNLQNALKSNENFSTEIERARKAITDAYNQLEELLFLGAHLSIKDRDISKYIDKVNGIYVLFRQAINSVRFNTDVYQDQKWCEGCTLCEIKVYGDFVKSKMQLQRIFLEIDREISSAMLYLTNALDTAADSTKIISKQKTLMQLETNIQLLLSNLQDNEEKRQKYSEEITKRSQELEQHKQEILENEKVLDSNLESMGENNLIARKKIQDILTTNKPLLDSAIFDYFYMYNMYSKQVRLHIEKNGRLNSKCKKVAESSTK